MDHPGAAYQKLADIRAPSRLDWHNVFRWRWHPTIVLLLCDIAPLAIAGRVAAHLNRFYAPLPPPLILFTTTAS